MPRDQFLDASTEMEQEGVIYLYDGGLKVRSAEESLSSGISLVFDKGVESLTR